MDKGEEADLDWRLDLGPENLFDATLVKKRYRAWSQSWEHEHCIYCTAKFMDPQYSDAQALQIEQNPQILTVGFVLESGGPNGDKRADYYWVCERCVEDFSERFRWSIVIGESLPKSAVQPSLEQ